MTAEFYALKGMLLGQIGILLFCLFYLIYSIYYTNMTDNV